LKTNEDAVGLNGRGERFAVSITRLTNGIKMEWQKEMSAAECNKIKKLLQYLITEQTKSLIESMAETEISLKKS
jgi:hypothetical protein